VGRHKGGKYEEGKYEEGSIMRRGYEEREM